MDLSAIHFHDSRILQVTEHPETDDLIMKVYYPVDWENNVFELRFLIFRDMLNYEIHEGPCEGRPTILDVTVIGNSENRSLLRIDTNFGYRQLLCAKVDLAITEELA